MIRQSFNTGWEVIPNQGLLSFGKAPGRPVTLPYDDMLQNKRSADAPAQSHTGYFPNQVCTLTKRWQVPADWQDKHVVLEFEGVYTNSMVYINGDYAGSCPHGYTNFLVEADDYLQYGQENEVKVVAKTSVDSRWYSGVGIYRDVNLLVGPLVHTPPYGHKVLATEVDADSAVVTVSTVIENTGHRPCTLRAETQLLDAAGQEVAIHSAQATVYARGSETLHQRVRVPQPRLWQLDDPHLYTAVTRLYNGEEQLDESRSSFGIRTLALDTEQGLRLNGKTVKLRGACVHHDNGIIGAAAIARAEERRVQLLKQAGFNAVRSAHNPISRAFLDACDREGVLVMDEYSDVWTRAKTDYDYSTAFPTHWRQAVQAMVDKDYNHPSVVMYSTGNEIPENGTAHGAKVGRQLAEAFRSLDPSRYVINSANLMLAVMDKLEIPAGFGEGGGDDGAEINEMMTNAGQQMAMLTNSDLASHSTEEAFDAVDIAGYNYATERYLPDRERYPNRVLCGSETFPKQIAQNWDIIKENGHVIGDFTWTGWDYLGEAGIGKIRYAEDGQQGFYGEYPWYIAYCGDLDITGHRRPVSYFREIVFGLRSEPYIAVRYPWTQNKTLVPGMWDFMDGISSWSWAGYEGKPVEVEVYAPGDKVELLLNGQKVGEAPLEGYRAMVPATYQPGELVAVAYQNGKETGRTTLRTAGDSLRLQAEADRAEIQANDSDLAYLSIHLTDADGIVNNMADRKVTVTVTGDGELLGLGSANPKSEENFRDGSFTTFEGRALAVIRPTGAGSIQAKVTAEGCESITVAILAK